jgi:putative aldouronate transport system permease protein
MGLNKKPQINSTRFFRKGTVLYQYHKYFVIFLMLIPALVYYILFRYGPIYGVSIAFKDYSVSKGISASQWVGLKYFRFLFKSPTFFQVVRNTIIINFYKLILGFPAPIIFAILLNELKLPRFKKMIQTISYLPHFLSWVVLASIFLQFFSTSGGPISVIFRLFGMKPIYLLGETRVFRGILVITFIWKSIGWNSIIYLASLASIDSELYDAASVDGANRFQKIFHVTLPGLTPVITIMFIFAVGQLLNDDFDQVYNMYNTAVYSVADVISTYTYRTGLIEINYSRATAVGLFRNVIAFILVLGTNAITKHINEYGLW